TDGGARGCRGVIDMVKNRNVPLIRAAAIAAFVSVAAAAAPSHIWAKDKMAAAAKARAAEPAKSESELIEYKDLENRIGSELIIETTFNTIRRGMLTKYTNPALKIQLGPEGGSIELDVPAETIRSVRIVTPVGSATPAEAATPPQGNSSAKKN
ncbi:MAG: hypothetical protein ABIR62_10380, partial [Dokdonella sp.]|uniref:hypothetical protein n=1 Tax=Dokdonella sp. TaxID=2291710 RepID=UPI0032645C09